MASSSSAAGGYRLPALGLFAAALLAGWWAGAAAIGFELHHRFSHRVREWSENRAAPGAWWPEKRTVEYYTSLAHHDRALLLRGRFLAAAAGNSSSDVDVELAFAAHGNVTFHPNQLFGLYYAFVEVGTPKKEFLVALDTGSHLFWLPCDCLQCAPTYDPNSYGLNMTFNIYSPSNSSTSKKVLCSSSICGNTCPGSNSSCPYQVLYADNSTTTGVLVEDILYLTTEDAAPHVVQKPIIFGCGRNQTGLLLGSGSPDGLFGLAMEKIAVPSVLASNGLIPDSFSMCFGGDGIGRLDFGDKGSSHQQETPLDSRYHVYVIGLTGMVVGSSSMAVSFKAIVDSGASFAYLSEPMYTRLAQSFDSQVQEKRRQPDPNLPFEYCYDMSSSQTYPLLPEINFTTKGGSSFPVNDPTIQIDVQGGPSMYCLAVISNPDGFNIIGENFMTGLRIVFDRERLVLGWENFDCYKSTSISTYSHTSAIPPASSAPAFPPPAGSLDSPQGDSSRLSAMRSRVLLTMPLLTLAIL